MKKNAVQLAVGTCVLLSLIFVFGCYRYSTSSQACDVCGFIYNYQTLIAGGLALLAAFIASALVVEQVRVARLQSAVMTRDVLIDRLRSVGARRGLVGTSVRSITDDFNAAIYPDPEGGEADIHPEWAHGAAQAVYYEVAKFKEIQYSRSDPAEINAARETLILVAEELAACLFLIPIPAQRPWESYEHELSKDEQAEAEARAETLAKAAERELPGKITAVKRAGKAVDDSYHKLLEALRTHLRKIDDSILDGNS